MSSPKKAAVGCLQETKLNLILDLDHTLLHTIPQDRLHPSCCLENFSDIYQFSIDGDANYCVKFRPGIVKFLKKISQLFDIHVYTMGTRDYATAIIQIIINRLMDGVSVFNGKILTRSDTGKDLKNLSFILPRQEYLTLILDDSPDIWHQYKNQVIPIYPYKFFKTVNPDSAQLLTTNEEDNVENIDPWSFTSHDDDFTMLNNSQNNNNNNNPSQVVHKGPFIICSPHDNHLRSMYNVLASVHQHFFNNFNTTLSRTINIKYNLKWRRDKVLCGIHLLFSGVFPLGTNPREQILWKQTEYYGATCYENWHDNITHLVAARAGTDKVLEAERRGNIFVVTPNWLYDSLAHWIRLPENDFKLIRKKR